MERRAGDDGDAREHRHAAGHGEQHAQAQGHQITRLGFVAHQRQREVVAPTSQHGEVGRHGREEGVVTELLGCIQAREPWAQQQRQGLRQRTAGQQGERGPHQP